MSKSRAITRSIVVVDQSITLAQLRNIKPGEKTVRFLSQPTYEQVAALPDTVKVIEAEGHSSAFLLAKPEILVKVLNSDTGNYEAQGAGFKRGAGKELKGSARKRIKLEAPAEIAAPELLPEPIAQQPGGPRFFDVPASSMPGSSRMRFYVFKL